MLYVLRDIVIVYSMQSADNNIETIVIGHVGGAHLTVLSVTRVTLVVFAEASLWLLLIESSSFLVVDLQSRCRMPTA